MPTLFNLSLILNGFDIKKAKKELHQIVSFTEQEHALFLQNKKKEIVQYHLDNNPFYKNLVDDNWDKTWHNLPILNKHNLQQPIENRLSNGFSKKNVYINKTSVFAKDKYTHALTWASNMYRFGWFNINFNHSLQARFYGIPLDFVGNTKERIKDFFSNRYRFSIFDLSDKELEKIIAKFQTTKFHYINGYTSSIVLFAKFLKQKNIILKDICPTLTACMVTSEMLFDDDKKLLETQFNLPIINEYGASELDLIAFENTDGEWQINAETIYVEILDNNNQALPYGKNGRIVITSLYNLAHPFIRYEIGDIGILDEKSTPQKQILKQLIGRTNDIAILPSGKKSPGLTFYYVTKSIIENDGNVKQFVITQTKIDTFEIDYVANLELDLHQINKTESAISIYLEPNLNFIFNKKENLDRTNRGKLKQFSTMIS
jgi:phenylacetate-CoA ligase